MTVDEAAATLREALAAVHWARDRPTVFAALDVLVAAAQRAETVEHREGMMEVYDWEGRYKGCIGSETWAKLLADPGRADRLAEALRHYAGHGYPTAEGAVARAALADDGAAG